MNEKSKDGQEQIYDILSEIIAKMKWLFIEENMILLIWNLSAWWVHFSWQSQLLLYFFKSWTKFIIIWWWPWSFIFVCHHFDFSFDRSADVLGFSHWLRDLMGLNHLRWSNLSWRNIISPLFFNFFLNNKMLRSTFSYDLNWLWLGWWLNVSIYLNILNMLRFPVVLNGR